MSFFQIIDVIMNSNPNRLGGPKSLGGSQYESNTYRFPEDIGNYDKGHYILININEQKNTQFPGTQTGDVPTVIKNMRDLQARRGGSTGIINAAGVTQAGVQIASYFAGSIASTSAATSAANGAASIGSTVNNLLGYNISGQLSGAIANGVDMVKGVKGDEFLRTIRRTTDTIALYMPDTLKFSYSQTYKNLELGGKVGSLAGAGAFAASAYNSLKGGDPNNIATFAAQLGGELGSSPLFKALATSATGVVKNPMLEVIYSQPNLRQFSFSFMFYPRSEKEALQVQKILDRLRFHQAPEIKNNTGGFFLIPPSEFDISFMYNGSPNPNIDKISTCVLTNISVDYAPKGFYAYEVFGENNPSMGRTGMPVGIGVTLSFLETQIITKEYYTQGSYNSIDDYLNKSGYYDPYSQASVESETPPI